MWFGNGQQQPQVQKQAGGQAAAAAADPSLAGPQMGHQSVMSSNNNVASESSSNELNSTGSSNDSASSNSMDQQRHKQQQQQQLSSAGSSSSSQIQGSQQTAISSQDKVSFHLKSSIFTRRVTLDKDKMALGIIKQLAIGFLNELYFQQQLPAGSYIGEYIRKHYSNSDNIRHLYERLQLSIYNSDLNTFVPFNLVSDIEPESYVIIEVLERQQQHSQTENLLTPSASATMGTNQPGKCLISHEFKLETFLRPTYCDSCSSIIKGIFRQGYQCAQCKKSYCPKCKTNVEASGEPCLVTCASVSQHQHALQEGSPGAQTGGGLVQPASTSGDHSAKLEIVQPHASNGAVGKRKSPSNLLHFNIANPFKSHHVSQAHSPPILSGRESATSKTRNSAGALDPVLQQLVRPRDQATSQPSSADQPSQVSQSNQQQQGPVKVDEGVNKSRLALAQVARLSNSHQNLFIAEQDQEQPKQVNTKTTVNSSSAHQSPTCASARNGDEDGPPVKSGGQLSSSARTSAADLQVHNKASDHNFLSMDWIQVGEQLRCEACKKTLRSSFGLSSSGSNSGRHAQQPAFMCKVCKIQVHANCRTLVLVDCMNRLVEASRAAACGVNKGSNNENANEDTTEQMDPKTTTTASTTASTTTTTTDLGKGNVIKSTNSNASRDNIRLCRLVPSVRQLKRPDASKPIIEGWLRHTTLSDELARKHYWRLDKTDITLYENDTSKRYFKAIALNKIALVMAARSLPKQMRGDILTSGAFELTNQVSSDKSSDQERLMGEGRPDECGKFSIDNDEPNKSPGSSPFKSAELQAKMRAIFALELSTGSMYLVQADSELEASRWLEALTACILARQSSQLEQLSAGDDVANTSEPQSLSPSTPRPQSGKLFSPSKTVEKGSRGELSTVNKLVESISRMGDIVGDLMGSNSSEVESSHLQPSQEETQSAPKSQAAAAALPAGRVDGEPANKVQRNVMVAQERQPPIQRPTRQQQQQQQRHHHHHHSNSASRRLLRAASQTDPNRSRLYNRPRITIKLDPMAIPEHLIECKYLIEADRQKGKGFAELGSGQFGKVYAAISEIKTEDPANGLWSGVPVAIKEISKARFDLRQQAKLKNEANILSRLDHQGIIILERVHDLPDKIYIVMEQLEDDMLEMIVSTEEKRLNERVTKFLTYQILEALKYLHDKNIAHCDLKPENVLLVERRSQFPQIKLCDFGFAKIIEENSFRSSLVGTPAYLAPEVVKGERYNRSVDLWSVGVIVYVSLSGEFPFNEGENIHDQISRATFMYPDQPWAKISQQAKNFINSLLRVNCEKRLSANRAQMDVWIQDYQLWCDLSELEVRVGKRWVTDDADYERWSRYAKEHQLIIPRAAEQLHEELKADEY